MSSAANRRFFATDQTPIEHGSMARRRMNHKWRRFFSLLANIAFVAPKPGDYLFDATSVAAATMRQSAA
jgi:hypothetical protein